MTETRIRRTQDCWLGQFEAMASTCDVLVDIDDMAAARRVIDIVAAEAQRIESKFSRYRDDSILHHINNSNGKPIAVDEETAQLFNFAARCYQLSDGRFDITSGVLREAWRFDGSDRIPTQEQIDALLPRIGWHKITWCAPKISVPSGMQLDLGGIGKEYAVDRAADLVRSESTAGVVVNFGGDLAVTGSRQNGVAWRVGIEEPDVEDTAAAAIEIRQGALATSGDTQRFLEKDGVRYSHVLDPRTGWPVLHAPRSVTILAGTCSEAGFLATMSMLEGQEAERFLAAQGGRYWCFR